MASKASSRVLTDREEIRRWAEERGAKPSTVRRTGDDSEIGIIRLDFPGYSGADSLEEVSWDQWFDKFEENGLALIVQEKTSRGQRSNFNKLVSRDSVEKESSSRGTKRKTSARSTSSGRQSTRSSGDATFRDAKKKSASSGSRTKHASGETKPSARSSSGRTSRSSRQSKSSGWKAA